MLLGVSQPHVASVRWEHQRSRTPPGYPAPVDLLQAAEAAAAPCQIPCHSRRPFPALMKGYGPLVGPTVPDEKEETHYEQPRETVPRRGLRARIRRKRPGPDGHEALQRHVLPLEHDVWQS